VTTKDALVELYSQLVLDMANASLRPGDQTSHNILWEGLLKAAEIGERSVQPPKE
jgi:hypothetical protein